MRKLQAAGRDGAVKAVLLQVDSPGGGLTASDQIYHQVRRLREKKPVVVYVGGMAASGGYYISAPATHIVVSPTGMVGSFGVIMTRFQIKELLDKIGIKPTPIMSTEMKDLGSPFRELTEEEKAYFKEMMTTYHARFVQIIAEGRGLAEKEVRALADGKLYTAAQAVGHGLADAEGYYEDALKTAVRLGEAKGARIIRYADPFPWQSLLQARAEWTPEAVRGLIEELAAESETPRFEARWRGQGE
jgi:protease IV